MRLERLGPLVPGLERRVVVVGGVGAHARELREHDGILFLNAPQALRAGEEVGKLLAERGAVVVTGGLSGVMEAVSRGAKNAGGLVIGILPGFDKRDANAYVDVAITTGMGWMRNTLVVRAADAVIMISGGIGTLNELTVAYEDKPTVILEGTGGWADRIRDVAYKGKHLD